mgnify:CR=1 FL=1
MWLGFSILILQLFFLDTVKSEAISATITDWGENHDCYPNRWSLEELWEDLQATEISQALLWNATGLSAVWSFDEDCEKIKLSISCQDLQTQKLMLNGIEVSKKSEKDREIEKQGRKKQLLKNNTTITIIIIIKLLNI